MYKRQVQQSADALHSAAAALPAVAPAPAPVPDMGFMHFVAQSDFVGKSLFIILILMSLVTWYLILVKVGSNISMRRRSADFLNKFWNASSLEQVEHEITTHGARDPFSHLASHAMHAQAHHNKFGATKLEEAGSNSDFVTRTMRKVIDEETAKLENGLTVLASVGSTAPFVGLFGTVSVSYTHLPSPVSGARQGNFAHDTGEGGIRPMGVSKAEWLAGELQSCQAATPRASAISGVTLPAGRMPPWPGLAPCDSLISIIFTCGVQAFLTKASSEKATCSSRQPK